MLTACGGSSSSGGSGGGSDGGSDGGGGGGGGGANVVISGKVQFERVPHTTLGALDYDAVFAVPVRLARVEAIASANGSVLAAATTDTDGDYAISVPADTQLFIRVRAQITDPGGRWDFRVVDNTRADALYALDGAGATSGATDSVRNLTATTGWGGSTYTGTRAAAPFAILDAVYRSFQAVLAVDTDVRFEPLTLNWSVNNVPVAGDESLGQIATTFYSNREIFVLGAADNDTDEFDEHVIAHEFGHYLEDTLGRADSTGGPHTLDDRLDPRLAFSEGWGYAWAGIALEDPVTEDSLGPGQRFGFTIDVEQNFNVNPGWYNEGSVQSILYDLYDGTDDGVDSLTLGFGALYEILLGAQRDTEVFTTLFTFISALKSANPADTAAIDAIVSDQSVVSSTIDELGSMQTNDAGSPDVLPVYTMLAVGAAPVTVCSIDTFGEFNKLSNRRFLIFDVAVAGRYDLRLTGPVGSDPDIVLWQGGDFLDVAQSFADGVETLRTAVLAPGRYLVEVYEASNLFPTLTGARGRTCLDVTADAV
jgi:hypothetical protein